MLGGQAGIFGIVFAVYMVILIAIGYLSAKKVQTIEDYYVAGRNVGPILLGIHYGTVYFSSVLMVGGGAYAYRFGLSTMWIAIGNTVLGAFLPFLLFGCRIRVFSEVLGALTLPDFFRERYQSRFMHVRARLRHRLPVGCGLGSLVPQQAPRDARVPGEPTVCLDRLPHCELRSSFQRLGRGGRGAGREALELAVIPRSQMGTTEFTYPGATGLFLSR